MKAARTLVLLESVSKPYHFFGSVIKDKPYLVYVLSANHACMRAYTSCFLNIFDSVNCVEVKLRIDESGVTLLFT